MNALLRVFAVLSLGSVVLAGLIAGTAVLPVSGVHVQQGTIPDGMALRIDVFSDVHLRVVSTASAGGEPRYEYRMTSLSEPPTEPLKDRVLSARCVTQAWAAALGQTCRGELLVVVKAGRPIHAYCHDNPIQADFGEDINVELRTCRR